MKEKMEKKEIKNENIKVFGLIITILIVMLAIYLVLNFIENNYSKKADSNDVSVIIKEQKTAVLYVGNSDSKKCKNCKEIKKYLDDTNINYIMYDIKKHSGSDYKKLLQSLAINPSDFNYPAIIYIKDGIMYSNIINFDQTKVIEQFIKDYDLQKVK